MWCLEIWSRGQPISDSDENLYDVFRRWFGRYRSKKELDATQIFEQKGKKEELKTLLTPSIKTSQCVEFLTEVWENKEYIYILYPNWKLINVK